MRRKKSFWFIMGLLCTILVTPQVVAAQQGRNSWWDWNWWGNARNNARDLEGRWYVDGERDKRAEINVSRGRIEARNERGQTTRLELQRDGDVVALDWQGGLHGDVRGNRIEWANGTTWTRDSYERRAGRSSWGYARNNARDLEGRWYVDGERDKRAEINVSRGRIEARNERGQTTRLELQRDGDVVALDWQGGLHGDVRGNRIEWRNGTTWTRYPEGRAARR